MEEQIIKITEWPSTEAQLSHNFPKPVTLDMINTAERPLHMNMSFQNQSNIPVCIKICEPICAESSYRVSINLLGQPFAEIVIKGITRLFGCKETPTTDPVNIR